LNQDSNYTFEFTPANALPADAIIEVKLPTSLRRSNTTAFNCYGTDNLATNLTCKYNNESGTVVVFTNLSRDDSFAKFTSF